MTDPILETRRQAYLEALYQRSGRTCSTYTGLFQQRQRELIEQDMAAALGERGSDAGLVHLGWTTPRLLPTIRELQTAALAFGTELLGCGAAIVMHCLDATALNQPDGDAVADDQLSGRQTVHCTC